MIEGIEGEQKRMELHKILYPKSWQNAFFLHQLFFNNDILGLKKISLKIKDLVSYKSYFLTKMQLNYE